MPNLKAIPHTPANQITVNRMVIMFDTNFEDWSSSLSNLSPQDMAACAVMFGTCLYGACVLSKKAINGVSSSITTLVQVYGASYTKEELCAEPTALEQPHKEPSGVIAKIDIACEQRLLEQCDTLNEIQEQVSAAILQCQLDGIDPDNKIELQRLLGAYEEKVEQFSQTINCKPHQRNTAQAQRLVLIRAVRDLGKDICRRCQPDLELLAMEQRLFKLRAPTGDLVTQAHINLTRK
jgi:hypothetical protein